MSKIGTCEHISSLIATRAGNVINKYRQYINKVQENGSMCIHCEHYGLSNDIKFLQHFADTNHCIYVRLREPTEMYCCYCGDFQYADLYDEIIGIKRNGFSSSVNNSGSNSPNKVVQIIDDTDHNNNNMDIDKTENIDKTNETEKKDTTDKTDETDKAMNNGNGSTKKAKTMKENQVKKEKIDVKSIWKDPRGIINMGSTCFMNSILQAILQNPIILSSIYLNSSRDLCTKLQQEQLVSSLGNNVSLQQNVDSVSSGCIACEMQSIVQFSSSELTSGFNSIVPANLLFAVWNYADHMAGYDQQDAHEFLIALLDGLGTHLDKYHPDTIQQISDSNKIQNTANNYGAHSTFVNDIFSGCMKSNLHCGFCGHQSCKYERFIDISLSLLKTSDKGDSVSAEKGKGREIERITLKECLQNFTLLEPLSELVMCDVCKIPQPAHKQLNMASLPKVLILHLKRFDSVKQQKLNTKVEFDLHDLDMGPYTQIIAKTNNINNNNNDNNNYNDMIYDLQGVVTHKGSLNSGHYVSYISGNPNNTKNRWLRCDDEHIAEVNSEEVKQTEPYILFYTKKVLKDSLIKA